MSSSNTQNSSNNRRPDARMTIDMESGIPASRSPMKRKTSKQTREEKQAAAAARRARSLSNGNTLGAFFHHDTPAAAAAEAPAASNNAQGRSYANVTGPKKKRPSRRIKESLTAPMSSGTGAPVAAYNNLASYRMPPPAASATGSDLGDMASMAIAGLGNDIDIGELMGGNASTLKTSRNRRAPPQRTGSQLPSIADGDEMNDFSASGRNYQNNVLGMYGGVSNTGNGRRRNSGRQSTKSMDSLRVSEVSGGLPDEFFSMLPTDLERDNSMFLSENSDMGGFNYGSKVGGGISSSKRGSLLGSSFLVDRQSSGSTLTQASKRDNARAAPSHTKQAPSQQEDIANFAAMLHADYGAADVVHNGNHPLASNVKRREKFVDPAEEARPDPSKQIYDTPDDISIDESVLEERQSRFMEFLDPSNWLIGDVKFGEDGIPYFEESTRWTLAGIVRHFLFNPISPEFTSLQQFCWAVIIGVFMGFYTAGWKAIIEKGVEFMWKELPEALLEWGAFTDLDGSFPLYHYMWICPAFWGGLLSYIFAILPTPIPGQNEWIENLHTRGVQDSETFLLLFVLSTLGMMSGLSLGPELPLILTSGMIGSWLGIRCKQSVLQARVMNITAGSAAIGGFFGFPMAGALFVMEVPHRMGLQYFEALSPATIASIVAVLCNRLLTGNDVTGYYSYPFLTTSLPSEIFTSAVVFGAFGALVGTFYLKTVLQLKHLVHDFFHVHHDSHVEETERDANAEKRTSTESRDTEGEVTPLLVISSISNKKNTHDTPPAEPRFLERVAKVFQNYFCCVIPHEPTRAAAAGVAAGTMVGVICMFVPHVMFWGEAQLQTLIDKGRTPLPVFGQDDEPTAALTALGFCMIDADDSAAVRQGFGMGCSFVITVAKIVTTGLSLGTGIIGGHFWGPLFSGCAASHFLTDLTRLLDRTIGIGGGLAAYPCVTILCTMGSTHVVTFRAHTAIMLILTLTISAFDPEDDSNLTAVAGDYSAVFPLLVISVFVSLMISRQSVFYNTQRSRGDIMALPEVLCEPGKEGMPMVLDYEDDIYDSEDSGYGSEGSMTDPDVSMSPQKQHVTQEDIEKEFKARVGEMVTVAAPQEPPPPRRIDRSPNASRGVSPLPPRPRKSSEDIASETGSKNDAPLGELSSARLDELLSKPLDYERPSKAKHRRIQSAPDVNFGKRFRNRSGTTDKNIAVQGMESERAGGTHTGRHSRSDSYSSQASGKVMRVATIGHVSVEQPSLMDQARLRAATSVIVESRHVRNGSMPSRIPRGRHSRQGSAASFGMTGGRHSRQGSVSSIGNASDGGGTPPLSVAAAVDKKGLPAAEVEKAYAAAVNRDVVDAGYRTKDGSRRPPYYR